MNEVLSVGDWEQFLLHAITSTDIVTVMDITKWRRFNVIWISSIISFSVFLFLFISWSYFITMIRDEPLWLKITIGTAFGCALLVSLGSFFKNMYSMGLYK